MIAMSIPTREFLWEKNELKMLTIEYLEQLLSVHWLRPETALWRIFDCLLMHDCNLAGQSIDLGCGDGTLSYIMAGGKIGNFDAYTHLTSLQSFNQGADIYNTKVSPDYIPDIDDTHLRGSYFYGVDHKEGLISKAGRFSSFYQNTMVHDINNRLPFDDGYFSNAFSNVLYWLDDLNKVLADWNRILSDSGKLMIFVPNKNFKEKAWLYYSAPHEGRKRYYNFFDRNYNSLIKHCYSHDEWEELFVRNGFKVIRHVKYLTDIVMEVWNIGTRPISPLLINMAENLIPAKRKEIKTEWIEYFKSFFLPIVLGELGKNPREGEYAFHFYILEKTHDDGRYH